MRSRTPGGFSSELLLQTKPRKPSLRSHARKRHSPRAEANQSASRRRPTRIWERRTEHQRAWRPTARFRTYKHQAPRGRGDNPGDTDASQYKTSLTGRSGDHHAHRCGLFIGRINALPAKVLTVADGTVTLSLFGRSFRLTAPPDGLAAGGTIQVFIRPEAVTLTRETGGDLLRGVVFERTFLGEKADYLLEMDGGRLSATAYDPLRHGPSPSARRWGSASKAASSTS